MGAVAGPTFDTPWPGDPVVLAAVQTRLGGLWSPASTGERSVAGCFVCFGRGGEGPGAAGDRGWVGAAVWRDGRVIDVASLSGEAGAPYAPGLLAAREGRLLEAAVRRLSTRFDVLVVNATGRDHPRRAGLALHLGAVLGVATVGVTHRPLCASGRMPDLHRGKASPVTLEGDIVGSWLCTRDGARAVVAHAAWGTDPATARAVLLQASGPARTPEPIRWARHLARRARALQEAAGP